MTKYDIGEVITAWKKYTDDIQDWEQLVMGVEPKVTDCGLVYELPNPIDRSNESFAIADMRNVKISGPHYHANGETEIYIILTGTGRTMVGSREVELKPGAVVVTNPDITHYTIVDENLVLALVNTPPFNPANAISITETDEYVDFDADVYARLKREALDR